MNAFPAAASAKQRAIEQEYERPFWEVVKGYADDGESKASTAAILGYSESAFRGLVARRGLEDWFPKLGYSNASRAANRRKRGPCTAAQRAALDRNRGPGTNNIKLVEFDGITDSIVGHARRIGLRPETVYVRRYRGMSLEAAFSPATRCRADHPWKKSRFGNGHAS